MHYTAAVREVQKREAGAKQQQQQQARSAAKQVKTEG
jgi:hypothetical protein